MWMTTVTYRQNEATSRRASLAAAYLIAVQCVLRRPGGDGDGVGLAAAVALAVQILSVPGDTGRFEFLTLLALCFYNGKARPSVIGERVNVVQGVQVSLRDCC